MNRHADASVAARREFVPMHETTIVRRVGRFKWVDPMDLPTLEGGEIPFHEYAHMPPRKRRWAVASLHGHSLHRFGLEEQEEIGRHFDRFAPTFRGIHFLD